MKNNIDIQPLVDVVKTLRAPNGCPWDQKQTHESLRRYFIEETYEVVDAIKAGKLFDTPSNTEF